MTTIMQPHVQQFAADNTDLFGGTFGAQVPVWFRPRKHRVQIIFSDSDMLFSARIAGTEVARNSGPHITQADNLQSPNWEAPHICVPVEPNVTDFEVLFVVNVVTAGVGSGFLLWER